MKNADILRRLRFAFDFNDDEMISIFAKGGHVTTRAEVSDWLKREEDDNHKPINDRLFAIFLNGFIIKNRGSQNGEIPTPESKLTNNIILRKLKIALQFKEEDMLEMFKLASIKISKSEISAFFRNPSQDKYMECKDQFLRNFLDGLVKKYRNLESEL
jgi:uncharacterized protein YehS (DUF1456 family)